MGGDLHILEFEGFFIPVIIKQGRNASNWFIALNK